MATVVFSDVPPLIEHWLERRRALGQDRFDEIWEGEYHVVPGPDGAHGRVDYQLPQILGRRARLAGLYGSGELNIGVADNYRVPDGAYLRSAHAMLYTPTAAIVVEIISPGDETRRKFDFYFEAGVEELLIIDPRRRTVEWFARGDSGFEAASGSALLGISAEELATELEWPD